MTLADAGLVAETRNAVAAAAGLFGLGLAVAFSPTNFGFQVDATDRHGPRWRPLALIAGGTATAASLVALLFLVVSPNTLHAMWTGHVRALLLQNWLDALVGAALVTVGVVQWRRAAAPRRRRRSTATRLDRPRVLFTIVVVNTLLSASNPASVYLVIRTIGTTGPSWWPMEYGVFLLGVITPYVLLAFALSRFHGLDRRIDAVTARIAAHDLRRPVAVGIMLLGVALLGWAGWEILRR